MNKKMIKGMLLFIFFFAIFFVSDLNHIKTNLATTPETVPVTDRIPIITFHRLVPDDIKKEQFPDNQWVGSIDIFASMMDYLYKNGYETINSEDFYEWYIGNREYTKKTVMITFDDGFYEDYYLALPILKKYNFKATSFVVGSRIESVTRSYDKNVSAFMGLDVIEETRKLYPNLEFQSHSYNMHYYTEDGKHRIRSMSYKELVEDTILNRQFNFTTFAYPFGDYNSDIQEILEKEGMLVAFRFGPSGYATRDSDRFAIPRIKLNGNATLDTMIDWLIY